MAMIGLNIYTLYISRIFNDKLVRIDEKLEVAKGRKVSLILDSWTLTQRKVIVARAARELGFREAKEGDPTTKYIYYNELEPKKSIILLDLLSTPLKANGKRN